MAQKALAEQAAARRGRERLAEEELFGASTEDPTRETVSSRALAEQERQAKVREGLSEAEVFGGRGEPGYGYRETVAKQALTEDQRQSQVREDLAREELYGGTERTGGDPGRKTVAKQALDEEAAARGERMDLARGELVGQVDGEKTVASRALEDEQAARGERMALAREEMYGGRTIQTGPEAVRQETQAAKEARQRHALMEGELLGKYGGKDTKQREALEAELTGRYGEDDTFAARTQKRREDMDALARSLAAREAEASGGVNIAGIEPAMRSMIQDKTVRGLAGSTIGATERLPDGAGEGAGDGGAGDGGADLPA